MAESSSNDIYLVIDGGASQKWRLADLGDFNNINLLCQGQHWQRHAIVTRI